MNTATLSPPLAVLFRQLSAFATGVLFAVGLGVSGMTQPGKVIGFLDFFGDWDPALLGVMGGGILVNALLFPLIRKRGAPLFDLKFGLPTRRELDLKLLLGAALFGAGWGIAGFCPGPALTSLIMGTSTVVVFVGFMVGGMLLEKGISSRLFR